MMFAVAFQLFSCHAKLLDEVFWFLESVSVSTFDVKCASILPSHFGKPLVDNTQEEDKRQEATAHHFLYEIHTLLDQASTSKSQFRQRRHPGIWWRILS